MKHKAFDRHRRPPNREPRRIYYLFCEGRNTEPGYFDALRQTVRGALIEIQSFPATGDPSAIAAAAVAHHKSVRRKSKNSFERQDEVWAVFDRDNHAHYYDCIDSCRQSGVGVANSNPCFELWLTLHIEEYHRDDGRQAVIKHLRKLRPDYDPTTKTMDFSDLIRTIDDAERRGGILLKRRTEEQHGKNLGPPYTMVFELTRAIRKAAREAI